MINKQFNFFSSPAIFALMYAVFAFGSSVIAAHFQGYLLSIPVEIQKLSAKPVWPLINNMSTLLDFALLNPLTIFLLQKSSRSTLDTQWQIKKEKIFSLYHKIGLIVLSAVIAVASMNFYYSAFLSGQYYDSNILPGPNGPYISLSGWVVFFWTSFFMALLFYRVFTYAWHVFFIVSLAEDDIDYTPFHPDESGGLRFLVTPSLTFLYAMMVLLAIFIVFAFQDTFYQINESNRYIGFAIYAGLSVPLFFAPLFHIHLLMKRKQRQYLADVHVYAKSVFENKLQTERKKTQIEKLQERMTYVDSVESVDKYKNVITSFPLWPLPKKTFVTPIISFVGSLLPLAFKFLSPYVTQFLTL